MWFKFLLLALVIACRNAGEPIIKVISVGIGDSKQLQVIDELRKNPEIKFWTENNHVADVAIFTVPKSIHQSVIKKLQETGMKPETVIDDLQELIIKEKNENMPSLMERSGLQPFRHHRYMGINEIYDYLRLLSNERSDVIKPLHIGSSYEERPILGIKITSGKFGIKPVVFLECGIHAREWISPATCLYITDQLSRPRNKKSKKLIEKYEWHIIPSTNPDGYEFSRQCPDQECRMWRRTRSINSDSNCMGVDANRNFDIDFDGGSSSTYPCAETYRGETAFSEPETRAIRDTVLELGSRIKMYFAIHSFGQAWMYPLGYTRKPAPNDAKLKKLAKIGVDAIKAVHGTKYRYGTIPTMVDITASGSSADWVYEKAGVRYVFALELRANKGTPHGFELPKEQIVPTGEETLAGIAAVVNAV